MSNTWQPIAADDQDAHDRYMRDMGVYMLRASPQYDWPAGARKGMNTTDSTKARKARAQRKKMKKHRKRGR